MKVQIQFLRKCFRCLYLTKKPQTLIWDNGFTDDNSFAEQLEEDDLGNMVSQLHSIEGIVCENCGEGDDLGFMIIKANNNVFATEVVSIPEEDEVDLFSLHSDIMEYCKKGLILFCMRDGSGKVTKVDGVMTSYTDGEKTYNCIVFQEAEDYEEDLQLDLGGGVTYQHVPLKDIKQVEFYCSFDELDNL